MLPLIAVQHIQPEPAEVLQADLGSVHTFPIAESQDHVVRSPSSVSEDTRVPEPRVSRLCTVQEDPLEERLEQVRPAVDTPPAQVGVSSPSLSSETSTKDDSCTEDARGVFLVQESELDSTATPAIDGIFQQKPVPVVAVSTAAPHTAAVVGSETESSAKEPQRPVFPATSLQPAWEPSQSKGKFPGGGDGQRWLNFASL